MELSQQTIVSEVVTPKLLKNKLKLNYQRSFWLKLIMINAARIWNNG